MTKSLIARQLSEFFEGSITLQQLEEWTISHLQAAEDSENGEVLDLIDRLDASIMEFEDGLIEEVELHKELGAILAEAQTLRLHEEPLELAEVQVSTVDHRGAEASVSFPSPAHPDLRFG